jgi:hypothetical protein
MKYSISFLSLKESPKADDGNIEFEVWTIENPMVTNAMNMIFGIYLEFDYACFIFLWIHLSFHINFHWNRNGKGLGCFRKIVITQSITEPDDISTKIEESDSPQVRV